MQLNQPSPRDRGRDAVVAGHGRLATDVAAADPAGANAGSPVDRSGYLKRGSAGNAATGPDRVDDHMANEQVLISLQKQGMTTHGLVLEGSSHFGAWPMSRWRLANGLRILLLPDPSSRLVAFHTWVGAGSADEVAGKTGLAHLLEHLMFKASANFPAGTFDRVLERMGSSPNAATWLDWTMFHQTIVPEAIAEVAAMEADRLARLALTVPAFAAELDVVRAERREAVDNDPDGQLEELFARCMWGGDVGYGHPTLGSAADLRAMSVDDARGFYAHWYAPGNVVVVLAGAVDITRDLGLLAAAYGGLPASSAPIPARAPVAAIVATRRDVTVDLATDRLLVGWRAPAGDSVDQPALALLAELLGNADSARFDRALVDVGRIATGVDVDAIGLARAGTLEIRVVLRPGRRGEQALTALDAEISALLGARPITALELAAARNRMLMARYASLDGVDGRAEVVGAAAVTFGDPRIAETWWRGLLAVNLDDVQRVAHTVFGAAQRVVVVGSARVTRRRLRPK